jgi:PAS domain S-box-containing protein
MTAAATEAQLRRFLDEISFEHLRPWVTLLSALFALAAVAFAVLIPAPVCNVLGAAALGSAVGLLVLRQALGYASPRVAHPVGASIAALTLLNACLYLVSTRDVDQAASFSVILLACACFFLSWSWLLATALGVVGGFVATIAWVVPAPESGVPLPSLVLALALGGLIHQTRLRAYRRLGEMHFAEARIRDELERSVTALRESEEGLRYLAESSSEGILIHEAGRILEANSIAAQIAGRPRAELLGLTLSVLFARDQSEKPSAFHVVGQPFEATIERPDGTRLPVEVSVRTVPFHGQLASVITLRDVTDRRRAKESSAARQKLEHLVTTIAADLVKLPPAGLDDGIRNALEAIARLIDADHARVMLLTPGGEVLHDCEWQLEGAAQPAGVGRVGPLRAMPWLARRMTALEAVHVPDVAELPPQAAADKAFLQACGVGSLIAVPIAHGDRLVGSLSLSALHGTRVWYQETVGLMRIVAEIIASAFLRQHVLEELEASETRKAAILEAALDCIITTDERGRVVEFNPSAEKAFGYRRRDAVGRPLRDLIVPERLRGAQDDVLRTLFVNAERPVLGRHIETIACRADGSEFPAEFAVVPIQLGREAGFTVYLRDITERRDVERLRDELVATVSHELRTPLTSLRGFAELMLKNEYPLARQRKFLGVIHNEAVRLTQLVNDFLDMKRIESGRAPPRRDRIEIRVLLREIETLFGRDDGLHEFRLDLDPMLTLIWGDPGQLRQVLINLVSNAIKFSPHGGKVTLGARNEAEGVLLWVTDDGIGISPEGMRGLFHKFYRVDNAETRSIGGTGLGLALVKEIVTAHGGRIWVESIPGSGSTFYVSLPTLHDPVASDSSSEGSVSYAQPVGG